jgi:MYXO-CTERM domain-containing protein
MMRSKFQSVVLLGGALLAAVAPASANLVTNGSFENPVSAGYNGFPGIGSIYNYIAVNCGYTGGISSEGVTPVCGPITVDSWTYGDTPTSPVGNSGGAGVAANGSAFGNSSAPDGSQVLFLQNQTYASQTIAGVTSGATYTFSFYVEQRSYGSQQTLDVTLGNQTLFIGSAPGTSAFTLETGSIVSNQTGNLALKFAGLTTAQYGADATVFVDDVSLESRAGTGTGSATPEPGFYGALALGLGGLAAVIRRRKQVQA